MKKAMTVPLAPDPFPASRPGKIRHSLARLARQRRRHDRQSAGRRGRQRLCCRL